MNKVDRLAQVRQLARNNHDAVTMLLSACADMANGNGVLLSVKAFDRAADMIISYLRPETAVNVWRDTVDERPAHNQPVLFVFGGQTMQGIYSDPAMRFYTHGTQMLQARFWMPLPVMIPDNETTRSVRISLQQAMAGDVRPVDELWDGIDGETAVTPQEEPTQ